MQKKLYLILRDKSNEVQFWYLKFPQQRINSGDNVEAKEVRVKGEGIMLTLRQCNWALHYTYPLISIHRLKEEEFLTFSWSASRIFSMWCSELIASCSRIVSRSEWMCRWDECSTPAYYTIYLKTTNWMTRVNPLTLYIPEGIEQENQVNIEWHNVTSQISTLSMTSISL